MRPSIGLRGIPLAFLWFGERLSLAWRSEKYCERDYFRVLLLRLPLKSDFANAANGSVIVIVSRLLLMELLVLRSFLRKTFFDCFWL